jgi:hypothetical protein
MASWCSRSACGGLRESGPLFRAGKGFRICYRWPDDTSSSVRTTCSRGKGAAFSGL